MNKFVNIVLLILAIPTLGFALLIGFDLPIELLKISGANFEYTLEVFSILAGMFGLLGIRRIIRRWTGVNLVSKVEKYQWNEPMDKARTNQAVMYLNIEAIFHAAFALGIYMLTPLSWPLVITLLILAFEHFLFGWIGKSRKLFRVGVTKNAVVFSDRDTKIAYFSGLRQISVQQQTLYFDYIEELQISFPSIAISPKDRNSFRTAVENNVDRDKVYFAESFKDF